RSIGRLFPPREAGLLMGLALGDDSRLDPALARDFQATGLGHLLVVSGDTGPHVSPPDRRRDPSAIMGTAPGFRTSRTEPEGNS
ncbi:MAG TPA: ComEC/Rec2 family competence protein, partial [Actinomycetota bacterium]|nr:ComEC/Rec2 family competence protein [Actinomycetota bacterium]